MVLIPHKKKPSLGINEIASVAILSALVVADVAYAAGDGTLVSTVKIDSATANGPTLADGDFFGASVANIGDLNDDGVDDIAVGANGDGGGGISRGAIHIMFMNTDGSVDSTVEINDSTANGPVLANGDGFGLGLAGIGDLNDDGVEDIVVGAFGDDEGGSGRGAVHIMFMNTDGTVDSTVEINDSTTNGPVLADFDGFGNFVANIGDLNDDGVDDIAVGANGDDEGGTTRGAVHIMFMNTDGSVDSTVEINDSTTNGPVLSNWDYFGSSVANIGDLNDDGVDDLAVGAKGDAGGGYYNRGAVHIMFMNTDGSVDSTVEINDSTTNGPTLVDEDRFGAAIASIGDLDGDSVDDLVVGAWGDDEGGDRRGALHILFMNTDGSVDSTVEINDSTTNGPVLSNGAYFGASIDSLGDFDGNGSPDFVVGARRDSEQGANQGAVHILYLEALDETAPTTSTLSPADNATDVAVGANLVMTFDETVVASSTGDIIIHKGSDDSIVTTIPADDAQVTINDDEVTINPTADLEPSTAYYVLIDEGAFEDAAGNPFAGISLSTTWNFTTVAAPEDDDTPSSGGGSSSHRRSSNTGNSSDTPAPVITPPTSAAPAGSIESLMQQLVVLLTQLLEQLLAEQQS